jgi:ATP-dependent Lon protease
MQQTSYKTEGNFFVPLRTTVILPLVKSVLKLSTADYKLLDENNSSHVVTAYADSKIGTLCRVVSRMDGSVSLEGSVRVRIVELNSRNLKFGELVSVSILSDSPCSIEQTKPIVTEITLRLNELIKLTTSTQFKSLRFSPSTSPEAVSYIVTSALLALPTNIGISTVEGQKVLEELDLLNRLRKVNGLLLSCLESAKIVTEVNETIVKKNNSEMRKHLIKRQILELENQLKTLEPKSDDGDNNDDDEITCIKKKITKLILPSEIDRIVKKELKRLESIQPHHPEYPGIMTYLETVVSLPWSNSGSPEIDISIARNELEKNHYGLEKVKKRIIEFLAVQSLVVSNQQQTVLCLHGGPGVGKTSIVESIAVALGRKFVRIPLSGVRDESELRGHRKTYIGAMAGIVIQSLIRAGTDNPVILLDEIDKINNSTMNTPRGHGAANVLLELLDPEQNKDFRDAYLNFGFDLSKCLFVCTCNDLAGVSGPLRDRLEIVTIPGYTEYEKFEIAKRHLLKKGMKINALDDRKISVSINDDGFKFLINHYTHEPGVRGLTRRINDLCRHYALEVVEGRLVDGGCVIVDETAIRKILGPPLAEGAIIPAVLPVGVSLGLAVSEVGGDVLFIEGVIIGRGSNSSGAAVITGQLGDVMKESVRTALSLLMNRSLNKANSPPGSVYLHIEPSLVRSADIHVHFPTGAVQKDGPSAGVSTSIALASLFSGVSARADLASTGEITLRGEVLPIGGVKEKVIAAHRAGLKCVLLPVGNKNSLEDIPPEISRDVDIRFVRNIDEVMSIAFPTTVDALRELKQSAL